MTIAWSLRAAEAMRLAKLERAVAATFAMRTHRRKHALRNAQFYEQQAAYYTAKSQGTPV